MAGERDPIEHRHLRSAVEFAVLIAAEGQKRKPPLPFPPELRPHFSSRRIPNSALGRLRRSIEADPVFRSRLAAGALPELVDDIGRLWLAHRTGWERAARRLIAERESTTEDDDLRARLARAERRRAAAEQATVRAQAEIARLAAQVEAQHDEIELLRADTTKAEEAHGEVRAELVDVRNEIRHARDREAAAEKKLATVTAERDAARDELARATDAHDDVDAEPAALVPQVGELEEAAAAARRLADRLDGLVPRPPDRAAPRAPGRARRSPLPMPPGVISTSAAAAGFLAGSGALMIVDGYNVAKLGWPTRDLAGQRDALLAALEQLANRFGTEISVVFDGAEVVGAHSDRRRFVRVSYSPAGVTADDVIRDEVGRIPVERAVVVVSNDAEVVRDGRARGANTLPSNALLAIV